MVCTLKEKHLFPFKESANTHLSSISERRKLFVVIVHLETGIESTVHLQRAELVSKKAIEF